MIAVIAALALSAAPLSPTALVKSIDADVQKVSKEKDAGASAKKLSARVDEVIDFGELSKRAMGAKWDKLTRKQLIDAMVADPVLIERPIVLSGSKAALGRPPEAVLAIL